MKTLNELVIAFKSIQREASRIMMERHQRYGYDNIMDGEMYGVVTRMGDKLARLRTIVRQPELEQGDTDTLRDTFLDMANYATIGILLMDGTWGSLARAETTNESPACDEEPRILAKDLHQLKEAMGRIQEDVNNWSNRNFGEQPAIHPMMGLFEEMGELAHAWLKDQQGIRTNEPHEENMKDALGDWMVFAMDFCSRREWKLGDVFVDTWNQVRKRDWTKNKEDGVNA